MKVIAYRSDPDVRAHIETSVRATGWIYGAQMPAMQDREAERVSPARRRAPLIGEDRLEKSLRFLAETDTVIAELKAQVERKEYLCKLARARMFTLSTQGSNEAKRAEAECSKEVQGAETEKCEAIVEYEKLKSRRQTEVLIVDVFRTIEASRRVGQI